jgi:hypothetical protein
VLTSVDVELSAVVEALIAGSAFVPGRGSQLIVTHRAVTLHRTEGLTVQAALRARMHTGVLVQPVVLQFTFRNESGATSSTLEQWKLRMRFPHVVY